MFAFKGTATMMIRRTLPIALLLLMGLGGCSTVQSGRGSASIDRVPLDFHATKSIATASGLRYHVVHSGPKAGRHPASGDTVAFDYEGKLLTGAVFDSSFTRGEPLTGAVGNFVPGFNEALMLMRPGDDWIVWIPPELGYGAKEAGPIPANSTLRFRMILRSVTPAPVAMPARVTTP